jgi:chaperonin GroEL
VEEDEASNAGVRVVALALQQPIRTLIENAKRSATQMMAALESSQDEEIGFDAVSGNLADLEKQGILDSAKALRVALGTAFSHARRILETGAWDLSEPVAEKKPS